MITLRTKLEALLRKKQNNDIVKGLTVEVRNGDFNGALRRFKKKVQEANIIQDYRERQEYVKPSEIRKKAKAAGRARWLKKQRKMELDGSIPTSNRKRK